MCGCLLCTPNWRRGLQPRNVPWLGMEPVTLWFAGWHSIHWVTAARSALKFLTRASTCINLHGIMLSEICHQRTNTVWFHLQEIPTVVKLIETEGRKLVATGERREGEVMFDGYRVVGWENEKRSRDGWRWQLYSNVKVLNVMKLPLKMVNFMQWIFYHDKRKKKSTLMSSHG